MGLDGLHGCAGGQWRSAGGRGGAVLCSGGAGLGWPGVGLGEAGTSKIKQTRNARVMRWGQDAAEVYGNASDIHENGALEAVSGAECQAGAGWLEGAGPGGGGAMYTLHRPAPSRGPGRRGEEHNGRPEPRTGGGETESFRGGDMDAKQKTNNTKSCKNLHEKKTQVPFKRL